MRNITLLVFFTIALTLNAQDYDFGKVSKEELQEKFNPLDSTASATYLYKKRKSYFSYDKDLGFQLVTNVHERIKIYNSDGFKFATHKISLYKDKSEKEKISYLDAHTYNLINEKTEENKLKKDAIFNTERNAFYNETAFTLPNIKEGSVIEYRYEIVSPFYWNIKEYQFQHDIPIKKIEAVFEAPEYFNFKPSFRGFLSINPKNETKNSNIHWLNKVTKSGTGFGSGLSNATQSLSEVRFLTYMSSYKLSDIPALLEEPYVNNINNYRSSVKYELSYTKFPDGAIKHYSTTWEDAVNTIYESSSFGVELNKKDYFEDDINALTTDISDPVARASLIFNFVKSKVTWNEQYGKFCDDGVKKAYKEKVGNVAEINLMLTAMLRYAGLNANPVLVSTRQNGIPLFPTIEGYNYVISCIETDQGAILLDATSKYSTPNILPFRTLNWEGRIIRKDKSSSTINLYPENKSKNHLVMMVNLSDNGRLEGSIRTTKTFQAAMKYREEYVETDKGQYLEKLENNYNGIEISDFEVINDTDLSKPIVETYKFTKENQVDVIEDKIYFSPLFFLKTDENPFKLKNREFPVDFGYPSESKYILSIHLPAGYTVESIPDSFALELPENLGSYRFNILQNGDKIQLTINTEINQSIISPIYYESLKAYFSKIIELENEQIVLTKI